jgi:hypothetical protein
MKAHRGGSKDRWTGLQYDSFVLDGNPNGTLCRVMARSESVIKEPMGRSLTGVDAILQTLSFASLVSARPPSSPSSQGDLESSEMGRNAGRMVGGRREKGNERGKE